MTDAISFNNQGRFNNLFNVNDDRYNKSHKSVEEILLEVSERSRDTAYQMKVAYVKSRMINQDGQLIATQDKIKEYLKKFGVSLDSVGVLFSVGGALLGGAAGSVLSTLGSQGFRAASEYSKERTKAKIDGFDFTASRQAGIASEIYQEIQQYGRSAEQDSALIDRVTAGIHRIFELMISSSS